MPPYKSETEKLVIECDCGTHLLSIQSEKDFHEDSLGNRKMFQTFYFAMFTYGTYNEKPNIFQKIKIVWNYLKTGNMHVDQLMFSKEEAKKLSEFIEKNSI